MKFCDITMAFNDKSGGIRTYLEEKRRYLLEHTEHEHLLIIPGEEDHVIRDGRATIVRIAGPLLPTQDTYRFFLAPGKIKSVLARYGPDAIELGSYYAEPWAAFSYRRRRREIGRPCVLASYFHTDVAEAYIAAPLRAAAHGLADDVSEALGSVVEKIADIAAGGAEQYIRYVFGHSDLAFASAPAQAERLNEYGVDDVQIVPMGVDLTLFSPERRREQARARLGAKPDTLVLVYAGRLSTEKRVLMLAEAMEHLPRDLDAQLWIIGDGPLREDIEAAAANNPSIRLLPYEQDRTRFAETLASADLYVTAGPHETFGLSVIEAQACGLPVVGVDAGALRERVSDGLGYLGPEDDARAMADNIVRAAGERETLSQNARAHVERHFSWNQTFRKLLDAYAEPLGLDRPARRAERELVSFVN